MTNAALVSHSKYQVGLRVIFWGEGKIGNFTINRDHHTVQYLVLYIGIMKVWDFMLHLLVMICGTRFMASV